MWKIQLKVGARFFADGRKHTVTAIRDGLLQTRDNQGAITLINVTDFLSFPDFRSLDKDSPTASWPFTMVSDEALKKARILERHLREVITGSPSPYGDPEPLPPKDAYDPQTTTLTLRVSLKAAELGQSDSAIWKYKRQYESHGVMGLVDQREVRYVKAFERIDPRIKDATAKVLETAKSESKLTKLILRERIKRQLSKDHQEKIKLPSVATLNRYIDAIGTPLGVFQTAQRRKSERNRPERPFGRFEADWPGQIVIYDSTQLNLFGLDPITLKWVQIQLTIAQDLYSRSIVAWRFTPTVPSVDAALLLFDVLSPKRAKRSWHESTRGFYFGVPDEVVLALPDDEEKETSEEKTTDDTARIPMVHPETVLIDHGRIFVSEAFRQACLRLGISLQYARRRAPTDKAIIETTFDFVKEHFCARLPGFTGANIAARGVNVENRAVYFIDEIEELFAEWVATEWQQRVHEGLFLPGSPKLDLSPNDVYREGIARAGFVYVVPDATLYYELLPSEWRVVGDNGVSVNGLFYDHVRLNDYRGVPSEYGGKNCGKYPVKYDQRNLGEIFFFDYRATPPQWIALRWRGARSQPMPFNDHALAFAKNLCIERQLDPRQPAVLEGALRFLLDRWDQQQFGTEKERRAMVKRAANLAANLRDRTRMSAELLPPDEPINLGLIAGELNPEEILAYIEAARSQPMGDEHASMFDF